MKTFIKVTGRQNGNPFFVNADYIVDFMASKDKDYTFIELNREAAGIDNYILKVRETPDEIIRQL